MRPVETYKGASCTVCVVRVEISYQCKANGNGEQRYFNYDSVFYKKVQYMVFYVELNKKFVSLVSVYLILTIKVKKKVCRILNVSK